MTKWLSILMLVAPLAQASPTTFYYTGVMYMTFVGQEDVKKSEYLLARTFDDNNEIHEVTVSKPGDLPYGEANSVTKAKERSIEISTTLGRLVVQTIDSDSQVLIRHVDVYQSREKDGPQVLSEQVDIIVNRVPEYQYLLGRQKLLGHL